MSGSASDVELLAAHASGDPLAFAELVGRHRDHLWQTALRTSYSRDDAMDALQEALLSVHNAAATFRADSAVRSWLHTIVVNACLDRIRRNKARPAVSLYADDVDEPAHLGDDMSGAETRLLVRKALYELPVDQRLAVIAVDMEGFTVAEAAARLGVPVGTVKSRCARARRKLGESLEFLRDPGNRN